MHKAKDIEWFKSTVVPRLENYEVKYKSFEKGDFGSLSQIEFNSELMGGTIDFWSLGWLGIHLVDYKNGVELLNVLLEPDQNSEKENAFEELQKHLKIA